MMSNKHIVIKQIKVTALATLMEIIDLYIQTGQFVFHQY